MNFYETQYRPLCTYMMKYPNYPPHMQFSVEILRMLEGEADVTVEEQVYAMKPGDFLFISPHQIHSFKSTRHTPSEMQCLICPLGECGSFQKLLSGHTPDTPYLPANRLPQDLALCMERILKYKDNPALLKAYAQLAVALFCSAVSFSPVLSNAASDVSLQLVSFLENNFTRPISVEFLSKELGINRSYVNQILKKNLKTSLPAYLNTLRLQHAVELLEETEMRIVDIADACGFDSLRTFNRRFKAAYNVNPRDYRKACAEPGFLSGRAYLNQYTSG